MEVEKEEEGGEKERVGLPSRTEREREREKIKAIHGMKNSMKVSSLFSHEILPSSNLRPTMRALAPEEPSRRDLHYEHSLMKEQLKGGGLGGFGS